MSTAELVRQALLERLRAAATEPATRPSGSSSGTLRMVAPAGR